MFVAALPLELRVGNLRSRGPRRHVDRRRPIRRGGDRSGRHDLHTAGRRSSALEHERFGIVAPDRGAQHTGRAGCRIGRCRPQGLLILGPDVVMSMFQALDAIPAQRVEMVRLQRRSDGPVAQLVRALL